MEKKKEVPKALVKTQLAWTPPPETVIQQVCSRAHEFAFLASSPGDAAATAGVCPTLWRAQPDYCAPSLGLTTTGAQCR